MTSSDGHSNPIYFNDGIPIGRTAETKAFVSSFLNLMCCHSIQCIPMNQMLFIVTIQIGDNGVISFRRGFIYYKPGLFPTNQQAVHDSLVVAPFWSDVDVRLEGDIYFRQFFRASGTESDTTLLNYISSYVAATQTNATNFTGSMMLVAQWKNVPPYPHGESGLASQLGSYASFTSKVSLIHVA